MASLKKNNSTKPLPVICHKVEGSRFLAENVLFLHSLKFVHVDVLNLDQRLKSGNRDGGLQNIDFVFLLIMSVLIWLLVWIIILLKHPFTSVY